MSILDVPTHPAVALLLRKVEKRSKSRGQELTPLDIAYSKLFFQAFARSLGTKNSENPITLLCLHAIETGDASNDSINKFIQKLGQEPEKVREATQNAYIEACCRYHTLNSLE